MCFFYTTRKIRTPAYIFFILLCIWRLTQKWILLNSRNKNLLFYSFSEIGKSFAHFAEWENSCPFRELGKWNFYKYFSILYALFGSKNFINTRCSMFYKTDCHWHKTTRFNRFFLFHNVWQPRSEYVWNVFIINIYKYFFFPPS